MQDTTAALEEEILQAVRREVKITAGTWEEHKRTLRGGTGIPVEVTEIGDLLDDDEFQLFEM